MKQTVFCIAAGIVCAAALPIGAQSPPDPPQVLRIVREDIKEGKSAGHVKSESAFMQEAARRKYPANIIGMTTVTGPSQAWFLEGHDSFRAVESTLAAFNNPDAQYATLDELDGQFRSASQSWLAVYRPDLSFHGQEMMQNLPKARFFTVDMIRIQNGRESDLAEIAHMQVDASQKAMSDRPVAVYQVVSGLANGTYLLFEPAISLEAMDGQGDRNRAIMQAMGDSAAKRFSKAISDTIVSDESLLFSIEPRMSYVSQEFASGDPSFWNPKPEETKAPAKKRAKAAPKQAGE